MSALAPASAAARTDLLTFTSRVARLAPDALIRLKCDQQRTSAWSLVLGVLVRHDFNARVDGPSDITVSAAAFAQAIDVSVTSASTVELPEPMDAAWRASLPPVSQWQHREDLPTTEILQTLDIAGSQLRTVDDAQIAAVGDSMLAQTIAMVDRDGIDPVELPMRLLLAMSRLGFLTEASGDNDVIRVATNGTWVVAATKLGAAFRRPATIDLLGML